MLTCYIASKMRKKHLYDWTTTLRPALSFSWEEKAWIRVTPTATQHSLSETHLRVLHHFLFWYGNSRRCLVCGQRLCHFWHEGCTLLSWSCRGWWQALSRWQCVTRPGYRQLCWQVDLFCGNGLELVSKGLLGFWGKLLKREQRKRERESKWKRTIHNRRVSE